MWQPIHQQRHETINGGLRRPRWRMSVWIWVDNVSARTDVELKNAAAWLSHIHSWGLSLVLGLGSVGCLITQCEKADVALCSKWINTGRGFWHMLIWLSRKLNETCIIFFAFLQISERLRQILSAHNRKHLSQIWLAGSSLYLLYFKYSQKVSLCVRVKECHVNESKMTSVQHRLFQREDFLSAASCGGAV